MPLDDDVEFKFPDEQSSESKGKPQQNSGSEIEIEIEDDAPPEDRGRQPLPKPLVEELEKDELDAYDDNVKTKLKQMRKVWHDERREKESALREQQEAVTLAQRLLEENKRIKGILTNGEKEYVSTIQSNANMELEMAKRAYKEAYEAGDSDKVLEAQQSLQLANIKLMQAKNFRMPSLQEDETPVQQQPVQYQPAPYVPEPDNKAVSWQKRNSWFGQNRSMTAFALGLHEDLRDNGVEVGSEDYYGALDKTMRKRFPEAFGLEEEEQKPQSVRTKSSTVVAPAVRSTAPNKVKLKQSQVNLARKLGLTPEQYVKAQLELEARNG
jgi:hypothetical protein